VASLIVPDVHLVDDLRLDRLAGLGQGPAQQDNLKGTEVCDFLYYDSIPLTIRIRIRSWTQEAELMNVQVR
jgi:hypothetical protein